MKKARDKVGKSLLETSLRRKDVDFYLFFF